MIFFIYISEGVTMDKAVPVGLGTFQKIAGWLLIGVLFITTLTVASVILDNPDYQFSRQVEIEELIIKGNIIGDKIPFIYDKSNNLDGKYPCPNKYYLVNANSLGIEQIVQDQMGIPSYCFNYYPHYEGVLLIPKK